VSMTRAPRCANECDLNLWGMNASKEKPVASENPIHYSRWACVEVRVTLWAPAAVSAQVSARQESSGKGYPFGWLGIMSETPPLPDLCYCYHRRGFALASMRSPVLSRYYIQCDLDTRPDERFWQEFKARCPKEMADQIVTGPSIEKSIAPLRSFVAEPMRYGRLFLAGDAAHIVPPTGAKDLNLAVSDGFYLSRALTETYKTAKTHYLDCYSHMALRRVWGAARLSWWLTILLHQFPDETPFDQRARENQFDYLAASERAQASLAEQYVGMPLEV
jgi:p-hydroxybenzoate 3-monooxygenase